MIDPRVQELKDWEVETGRKLPMAIEQITAIEDDGHMVDLESGHILINDAPVPFISGDDLILLRWPAE